MITLNQRLIISMTLKKMVIRLPLPLILRRRLTLQTVRLRQPHQKPVIMFVKSTVRHSISLALITFNTITYQEIL